MPAMLFLRSTGNKVISAYRSRGAHALASLSNISHPSVGRFALKIKFELSCWGIW